MLAEVSLFASKLIVIFIIKHTTLAQRSGELRHIVPGLAEGGDF